MGKHNIEGHDPDCDGSCESINTAALAYTAAREALDKLRVSMPELNADSIALQDAGFKGLETIRDNALIPEGMRVMAIVRAFNGMMEASAIFHSASLYSGGPSGKLN
jgi:hypothetical protein